MKTLYVTTKKNAKEWFAVKPTTNGKKVNFWHDNGQHVYLYTFKQNNRYSRHIVWNDRICRDLLEDLRRPSPSVEVVRFAVDGILFISDPESTPQVPQMPARVKADLKESGEWNGDHVRADIEDYKCSTPAPYILYGEFRENQGKEYAWRLTPDKPKRQGIVPGDKVLVWTRCGFRKVRVTRIEEAGDKEQPECRVKRKLGTWSTQDPPDEG